MYKAFIAVFFILSVFLVSTKVISGPLKIEATVPIEIKSAHASSAQRANFATSETFIPENAIDGDVQTRWSSKFSEPQWLQLDIGEIREIEKISILWERAYALSYSIEVSKDGQDWREVFSIGTGVQGKDEIEINKQGRYIRINCLKRKTKWGFSIREIKAYGKRKWLLI